MNLPINAVGGVIADCLTRVRSEGSVIRLIMASDRRSISISRRFAFAASSLCAQVAANPRAKAQSIAISQSATQFCKTSELIGPIEETRRQRISPSAAAAAPMIGEVVAIAPSIARPRTISIVLSEAAICRAAVEN